MITFKGTPPCGSNYMKRILVLNFNKNDNEIRF